MTDHKHPHGGRIHPPPALRPPTASPEALRGVVRYGGQLTEREQRRLNPLAELRVRIRAVTAGFNESIVRMGKVFAEAVERQERLRDALWADDADLDRWQLRSMADSAERRRVLDERRARRQRRLNRSMDVFIYTCQGLAVVLFVAVLVFVLWWFA